MNDEGQLGYEDTTARGSAINEMGNYLPPISLPPTITIQSFDVGTRSVGIISTDGELYCWGLSNNIIILLQKKQFLGDNNSGGLGIGTAIDVGSAPGLKIIILK